MGRGAAAAVLYICCLRQEVVYITAVMCSTGCNVWSCYVCHTACCLPRPLVLLSAHTRTPTPTHGQVMRAKLEEVRALNTAMHAAPGHSAVGIVLDGGALHAALTPELQPLLMELCSLCRAVVCCRVSPMQKAQVRGWWLRMSGAAFVCAAVALLLCLLCLFADASSFGCFA